MSQKYDKLISLLKELFQLDQPDLDFGLYRIMHAKEREVSQFLDRDLLPQVKQAFALYQTADKAEIEKELAKAIEQAQALGADPESLPKVKELRARLTNEAIDVHALESEVYDHLFSFFRRYYSEGDFLSKRVYKPGVYAIPYEGEEVKLHWANADQYYIKTSEYLRDYAFRLRPEVPSTGSGTPHDPMRVHFRLVDAVEGEHGNVKATEGRDRRFVWRQGDRETGGVGEENGELVIYFEYRSVTLGDWPAEQRTGKAKPPTQKELNAATERLVLAALDNARLPVSRSPRLPVSPSWRAELAARHRRADGTESDNTRLRVHLDRYTARNTFDYFIHKDLGAFLRRELDFYIKNEVMRLDDIENESAPRVEQYLSKIKVIRRVAGKIIDFLAQLEDFQKKLWLKKKFVVETSWLVRVGCIPEEFHADIAANQRQHDEWVKLYAIDEIEGDLARPGYSGKLTPEFLKGHPTLVVDTRHFDPDFTARLVDAIGDVDEQTDGVLFHSENFQALSLMQARYREQVTCIYIDPPYNTGNDGFAYKDSYQHSSWLSMLLDRCSVAHIHLSAKGLLWQSVDDNEEHRARMLGELAFGNLNHVSNVIWQKKYTRANDARWFSDNHDYLLVFAKSKDDVRFALLPRSEEQEAAYSNLDNDPRGSWKATPLHAKSGVGTGFTFTFSNGIVWSPPPGTYPRFSRQTLARLDENGEIWFGLDGRSTPSRKSYLSDVKQGVVPVTIWPHDEVGHSHEAINELKSLFPDNPFGNPKPTRLVRQIVFLSHGTLVLDFFAGSGTTGHAVINLNREDGGQRRFILVEMGDYFDTVLVPRLKKVTYSPEWKDGKPKRLATPEEAERSPRVMKVVRLESYEDTLNNLETRRSAAQQSLLDVQEAQGAERLREQYILRYMLDVETRGSQSLLNIQAFTDPTAYTLTVKRPGSEESRMVDVDLLETFNWLIGLTVKHIAAPQSFIAAFERDGEKRLRLKGRLRVVDGETGVIGDGATGGRGDGEMGGRRDGESRSSRVSPLAPPPVAHSPHPPVATYWFRTVTGTMPDGRRALVIWRKRPGGETPEGVEQDNLVLDEWFTRQGYSSRDSEFDLIYVNGGNNLENLKTPDDLWKVRLIEEDFHRLMFETEGVR